MKEIAASSLPRVDATTLKLDKKSARSADAEQTELLNAGITSLKTIIQEKDLSEEEVSILYEQALKLMEENAKEGFILNQRNLVPNTDPKKTEKRNLKAEHNPEQITLDKQEKNSLLAQIAASKETFANKKTALE